jgi:hypothetical protein
MELNEEAELALVGGEPERMLDRRDESAKAWNAIMRRPDPSKMPVTSNTTPPERPHQTDR